MCKLFLENASSRFTLHDHGVCQYCNGIANILADEKIYFHLKIRLSVEIYLKKYFHKITLNFNMLSNSIDIFKSMMGVNNAKTGMQIQGNLLICIGKRH